MLNKAYYFSLKMLKWNISIFKEVKEDFYCFVLSLTDFSPELWVILVAFIFTRDLIFYFSTYLMLSSCSVWGTNGQVQQRFTRTWLSWQFAQISGKLQGFGVFSPPFAFSLALKLYLNFKKLGGFSRLPKYARNCQSLCALLGNLHTTKIQMPSSVLQNIKAGI